MVLLHRLMLSTSESELACHKYCTVIDNIFLFLDSFASTAFLLSEGHLKPVKVSRLLGPVISAKCWQREYVILTSSLDT
jgi:hypothetical protein